MDLYNRPETETQREREQTRVPRENSDSQPETQYVHLLEMKK